MLEVFLRSRMAYHRRQEDVMRANRFAANRFSEGVLVATLMLCASVRAETPKNGGRVARGKYLMTIALCNDCHTPWKFNPEFHMPEQDWSRMLSGHPEGAPDPASAYKGHDMAVIGPTF